jgi:hypothetical protein
MQAASAADVDQSTGHLDRAPHATAHRDFPVRAAEHSDHGESEQTDADTLEQSALRHRLILTTISMTTRSGLPWWVKYALDCQAVPRH